MAHVVNLDGPTWVYQLHCAHGGVIYVGVAGDLRRRLRQHARTKSWWPEVRAVIADQYATRAEAIRIESSHIHRLRPWRNRAGKPAESSVRAEPIGSATYAIANGAVYDVDTEQRVI